MFGKRLRPPSTWVGVNDIDYSRRFFDALGWTVTAGQRSEVVVETPGGPFGLRQQPHPPRLELALNYPDPRALEKLAELVEPAGGLIMEPLQETIWGGWGFSFNDPMGNTWEIGHPRTVTFTDRTMSGLAPPSDGPIVALSVGDGQARKRAQTS